MQRKVFRIERTLGAHAEAKQFTADTSHSDAVAAHARAGRHGTTDETAHTFERQLAVLHDTFARHKRELAALIDDGKELRMARAAGELAAAVEGMEKATEKILISTEAIDDSAKALAAALKTGYERGLAQEVQEQAVRIYEACNFQDLAGQRIGKVIAMLNMIENQVSGMLDRYKSPPEGGSGKPHATRELLNGPRLDGDAGHTSQSDIDELFG